MSRLRKLNWVALPLILAGAGWLTVQQRTVSRLQSENRDWAPKSAEAERLAEENKKFTSMNLQPRSSEIQKLQEANKELFKVRGAIPRLREEAKRADKLEESARKLETEMSQVRSRLEEERKKPGFVPSSLWSNAGNATPEAALQTMLWAMREQQWDALINIFPESKRELMRTELKKALARDGSELEMVKKMDGFRIVEARDVSPSQRKLKVWLGGETQEIEFVRDRNGWVLKDDL